jgi:hypothetical protein
VLKKLLQVRLTVVMSGLLVRAVQVVPLLPLPERVVPATQAGMPKALTGLHLELLSQLLRAGVLRLLLLMVTLQLLPHSGRVASMKWMTQHQKNSEPRA